MSYVVLARKWRPEHFEQVVGQDHVARTLKNSIEQNRVAHAYLFTGARGVGKTSTARILARALNCKQGPTATPCYECVACTEISAGQSVDVFEIDGASNRGINEIRDLREGVRYAPSRDRYKIYIIDEVHMLTTEAFNALLKTLEEPPAHAIFVFATTEPQKIPVTILSRCQRFDFKRITQRDIVAHLEHLCGHEGIEAERAALQVIARQAAGGMRDALSLLDQIISFAGNTVTEEQVNEILGVANRKHLFELSEAILGHDAERALLTLDEVNRFGYDMQQFASELVTHFRDLMVVAVVQNPEEVTQLTETEIELARAQVANTSRELLHRLFSVMVDGARDMHRSPYPRLIFEMTLVRLAELEPLVGLDLLVDKLVALEKELEGAGVAPAPEKKKSEPALIGEFVAAAEASPRENASADTARMAVPRDAAPESADTARMAVPRDAEDTGRMAVSRDAEDTARMAVPREEAPASETPTTPDARWKLTVETLRAHDHLAVAAACEHAHVERFDDGVVRLALKDGFHHLLEQDHVAIIRATIQELFGPDYRLDIDRFEDEAPTNTGRTLAQQREDDIIERRKRLASEVRNNPAVVTARELFEADEPRVQVQLHDE